MDVKEAAARLGPMFEAIAADGRLALAQLQLPAGAEVLDVGTGAGNFAIFLSLQGFNVVTGEPETDTTAYARKDWAANAAAAGVADRIRFEPFDASRMPFADHRFAGVFFFGVLHHVAPADRERVVAEALRVVTPGGAVVYFEPTRQTLERIWTNDPDHPLPADPSAFSRAANVRETRLQGRRMDIYVYQPG
jgi:SAM-dependent methyltransferase